jgi:type IV pilus assembly protein PilA
VLIRFHQALAKKDKGFTLIELLVVIIIIGILAAIAIPAFLKQREKAWGSAVVSDLKNASIAAESYSTEMNGTFVDLSLDKLKENGYNPTADVDVAVVGTPGPTYELSATHKKLPNTKVWKYSSATGSITPPK